ncbi:Zinc finger, C2H2 type family protein [Tritrichomonas foetus]|uniref:Zinc finger, C2H2 type family protein n=1 Tax=Tritrichomonas foetus TaxID=1144522 RepID=A0A1J4KZW1_9EUKA|nr:Zinc finger, C2H2 type family protein [Tritrichomonas foetus]|eukprot:OHT16791.1 Zinc finger, C2H2 type family protein [Tritrichomonas foetus]
MNKKQKVWCYFCDKVFDDEVHLINHQRMFHFRCPICRRQKMNCKLLVEHMSGVHKQILEKVPNALEGKDSPDNVVFGMKGIPETEYVRWLTSVNPEFREKARNINLDGAVFANDVTRMASLAHKTAAHNITYNQLNQFNAAVSFNPGQGTMITARGLINSDTMQSQQRRSAPVDDVAAAQRRYDIAMRKAKEIIEDAMYQSEKERKRRAREKAKNEILYFEPENGLSVFEMRAKYLQEKNCQ